MTCHEKIMIYHHHTYSYILKEEIPDPEQYTVKALKATLHSSLLVKNITFQTDFVD